MSRIWVLHGPNLNLLGEREPELYGYTTLEAINQRLVEEALGLGHLLEAFQTNKEHELIDSIQAARLQSVEVIIINPAAFTHTSIALRDAFLAVKIPCIEVHLSATSTREPFRQISYLADIALGVISGFGPLSYELALMAAHQYLQGR